MIDVSIVGAMIAIDVIEIDAVIVTIDVVVAAVAEIEAESDHHDAIDTGMIDIVDAMTDPIETDIEMIEVSDVTIAAVATTTTIDEVTMIDETIEAVIAVVIETRDTSKSHVTKI